MYNWATTETSAGYLGGMANVPGTGFLHQLIMVKMEKFLVKLEYLRAAGL